MAYEYIFPADSLRQGQNHYQRHQNFCMNFDEENSVDLEIQKA